MEKKLTFKQQIFVDIYQGNAKVAARLAGYTAAESTGSNLMNSPHIIKALDDRDRDIRNARIATRHERQEFWTSVMRNEDNNMGDRLKAAETLGRSESDFVDRVKLEIGLGEQLKNLSDEDIEQKIRMLEESGIIDMISNKAGQFESIN